MGYGFLCFYRIVFELPEQISALPSGRLKRLHAQYGISVAAVLFQPRGQIPIAMFGSLYSLVKFADKLLYVFVFVFPNQGFYIFADMDVTIAGFFGIPFGFVEILRRADGVQQIRQPQ